jgi:hypothetical protein
MYIKLLCIIFFILLLLITTSKWESFFPFNSFEVPTNKTDSLYDQDTTDIDNAFEILNKDILPDYRNTFQKYPNFFKFVLNDLFASFIIKQIKLAFDKTKYNGNKVEVAGALYNIWWKDALNDRHFILNVDIVNKTKFFARKLLVFVKLRDIKQFLTDTGEYTPLVNDTIQESDLQVVYIGTDNALKYLTVPPTDGVIGRESFSHLYRIKNNLYLMDPYITSGRDMVISDNDKLKFLQKLQDKERENKEKTRGGMCYNTSNVTASTKLECIDSGGVWDYPPGDDLECPYFGGNQNYPNTFGKISGNKCELPRNMQLIGNRNFSYDPKYAPLCYNCKNKTIGQGTLGYCCEEQHNKVVYPTLLSPDYAFVGDASQRQKYASDFLQNNLSVV